MPAFGSIEEFLAYLASRIEAVREAGHQAVREGVEDIQAEAQSRLGHYQGEVGPFPAWKELAERTKQEREEQGYPVNEPGLRSGLLRDHVKASADGNEGAVGVPNVRVNHPYDHRTDDIGEIAIDFEKGSVTQPARPFLGPAAFVEAEHVAKRAGELVVAALMGVPAPPKGGK